ncbi:MAG: 1,4-dihydroxy-2-naphthoate polyprenyltransferase [Proteobacteria bacterium]|nr:1,4-dihydroxy-2-naphthoate polyprenyltransferase [Pseudomonadota bacterium]
MAAWASACRPRTLTASLSPVAVALALSWSRGPIDWPIALLCVLAAVAIQLATNLANDYFDFASGADNSNRLGPTRACQAGLLTPRAMRNATVLCLAVAACCGLWLVARGGLPVLVLGAISLTCAVVYTGGPWPLAYHGLGDVFVFVFFGPVAVLTTLYLQGHAPGRVDLLASLLPGAAATALLVVNNLRDIDGDQRVGKNTLAVRVGKRATRLQYALLLAAALLAPMLAAIAGDHAWLALPLLLAPVAAREVHLLGQRSGALLNESLAATARLHAVGCLLLSVGAVL